MVRKALAVLASFVSIALLGILLFPRDAGAQGNTFPECAPQCNAQYTAGEIVDEGFAHSAALFHNPYYTDSLEGAGVAGPGVMGLFNWVQNVQYFYVPVDDFSDVLILMENNYDVPLQVEVRGFVWPRVPTLYGDETKVSLGTFTIAEGEQAIVADQAFSASGANVHAFNLQGWTHVGLTLRGVPSRPTKGSWNAYITRTFAGSTSFAR